MLYLNLAPSIITIDTEGTSKQLLFAANAMGSSVKLNNSV